MKRKIIALLMATVSAASLLASCDGAAAAACKKHTDFDANGVCDACGREMVVIENTVQLEKEEKVPFERKEIPTDAKIGDFINWDMTQYHITGKAEKVERSDVLKDKTLLINEPLKNGMGYFVAYGGEGDSLENSNHRAYLITYAWYSNEDELLYSKTVEDTGRVIEHEMQRPSDMGGGSQFEFDPTNYNLDFAAVIADNMLPIIVEATYDTTVSGYSYTYTYCLPTGKKLTSVEQQYGDHSFVLPEVEMLKFDNYYGYLAIDGTVYALEAETYDVVYTAEEETFIFRPTFERVINGYGYALTYDTESGFEEPPVSGLYVYNVSGEKWIDCVYEKDLSDFAGDYYILSNGKILYQTTEVLPTDAVNYDYMLGGAKFDLKHVLVDVTTGEETEVQFGWYIDELRSISEMQQFKNVDILAEIVPIEDGYLSENMAKQVFMDNEMNILVAISDEANVELVSMMPVNKGIYQAQYVNGGLDEYGNEYRYTKYLDENMKEIDVTGFSVVGTYLVKENKIYAWSDLTNAKLDMANYEVVTEAQNFMILKDKEVAEGEKAKYYYFSLETFATPVEVKGYQSVNTEYDYFIVEKESDRTDPTGAGPLMDYVMYDCNNQVIGTFEANVQNVYLRDDCWEINLTNGDVWTVAHNFGGFELS